MCLSGKSRIWYISQAIYQPSETRRCFYLSYVIQIIRFSQFIFFLSWFLNLLRYKGMARFRHTLLPVICECHNMLESRQNIVMLHVKTPTRNSFNQLWRASRKIPVTVRGEKRFFEEQEMLQRVANWINSINLIYQSHAQFHCFIVCRTETFLWFTLNDGCRFVGRRGKQSSLIRLASHRLRKKFIYNFIASRKGKSFHPQNHI